MTTTIPNSQLESDHSLRRYGDVRDLLPDVHNPSPLVRLNRVGPAGDLETYLKLEWLNPFGSVKDRTAAYLLAGLEARGELDGREIVEASSGNTAIALAALGALRGTKVTVTIPDGVPEEKKVILRMLGAEVWETPDDLCPVDLPKDGAIALARSLAASEGGSRYAATKQYENEDNIRAHYETTGPEIWNQTEGRIRWFIAGYGTTGTLSGVGRYLKEQDPEVQIVGVEAEPGHRLPGLKSFQEAKVPTLLDADVIDHSVVVSDADAYQVTKEIWRREALMVGPSTGAVVDAATRIDARPGDVVVAISADSGMKYTSYFEDILGDEGRPTI
ncbi:MAG: PLP-dependent cysteine synthase family protein [Acidimicrobiia bacterium]|nr:PLP-dependent cysteine synthase family protein [Acidimicrobiia bacterium]MDH3462166.1 PLP-dependent cysteine synthase family protein [Acidimicrobiia bacterium]